MKKLDSQYWFGLVIGAALGVFVTGLLFQQSLVPTDSVGVVMASGLIVAVVAGVAFGVWRRRSASSGTDKR